MAWLQTLKANLSLGGTGTKRPLTGPGEPSPSAAPSSAGPPPAGLRQQWSQEGGWGNAPVMAYGSEGPVNLASLNYGSDTEPTYMGPLPYDPDPDTTNVVVPGAGAGSTGVGEQPTAGNPPSGPTTSFGPVPSGGRLPSPLGGLRVGEPGHVLHTLRLPSRRITR